jgi:hypothetical protein
MLSIQGESWEQAIKNMCAHNSMQVGLLAGRFFYSAMFQSKTNPFIWFHRMRNFGNKIRALQLHFRTKTVIFRYISTTLVNFATQEKRITPGGLVYDMFNNIIEIPGLFATFWT